MAKTGPMSAWDHLLRGQAYIGRGGMNSAALFIEETRQAVAAAPDLGLAHAMLAVALGIQVHIGIRALDDELSREIRTHVTRAMQLDGDDPKVLSYLVSAYNILGDGETALRLARRGVEFDHASPGSYDMLGIAYVGLGRTADAIAAFTQQELLTSDHGAHYAGLAWLGLCYLLEDMPAEAEAALEHALALRPDFNFALTFKAIVEAHRGKDQAALATVRRLRETEPMTTFEQCERMLGRIPQLKVRMAEHIASLRRLWDAMEGDG
jgi:tetratricopeptide (TPR) repeat protein